MRKRSLDQRLRIHLVYDQSVSSLPSHKEHLVKVCMGDSLTQWCTTSGPRATSGPRRVVKWPARPNRKSTISDTALTLKSTHLGLISQHLNDFKLKVQGENQLGYHLANYCSAFKA